MKQCFKCKKFFKIKDFNLHNVARDGLDPYCKFCRNRLSENYRKNNKISFKKINSICYKRWYENNKEKELKKNKCRQKTNNLIRAKRIKKQNCFLCNKIRTEKHHIDYDFPNKIIWLCRKHHRKIHHK